MKYSDVIEGEFVERRNRFISICKIDGIETEVYVPNTGRCAELFIKGVKVFLTKSNSEKRKTKYTLISVLKEDMLINIDSSAPNRIVQEAILSGKIKEDLFLDFDKLLSEKTYEKSRFDFYLEKGKDKGFIEVKGVTLEKDGLAMFPDAPTLRGVKHLNELIKAKSEGYNACIIFVIQMDKICKFTPNSTMHQDFADALWRAKESGVKILAYNCKVLPNEVVLMNKCKIIQGENND